MQYFIQNLWKMWPIAQRFLLFWRACNQTRQTTSPFVSISSLCQPFVLIEKKYSLNASIQMFSCNYVYLITTFRLFSTHKCLKWQIMVPAYHLLYTSGVKSYISWFRQSISSSMRLNAIYARVFSTIWTSITFIIYTVNPVKTFLIVIWLYNVLVKR